MDLGRWDLLLRTDLLKLLRRRQWYPVVVAETLHFRRSLKLLDRFRIETKVLGSDEKSFYIEQRFIRKDEIIAYGMIQGRFLSKRTHKSVAPSEVISELGDITPLPVLPEYVRQWLASNAMHHAEINRKNFSDSVSRGNR